jgi:hypothetical protein
MGRFVGLLNNAEGPIQPRRSPHSIFISVTVTYRRRASPKRTFVARAIMWTSAGYRHVRLAMWSHMRSAPERDVSTSAQNVYETLRDK